MKICYIFSNFHLSNVTGQPAIIFKLARYAADKGEEVYMISNISGIPGEEKLNHDEVNSFLIKGLGDFKTYFLNIFKIIEYLRRIKPDIVHVHGHLLIIFIWFIGKFLKVNLACSLCETLYVVNGFYRKLLVFCLKHSKKIFVTADYVKKQLIKKGILSDKITVVRIGLDEKFAIDSNDSKLDTDILFYGDSKRERGFDIIFHLAKNLPHLKFKVLLRWEGRSCQRELREMKKMSNVVIRYYPYSESLKQIILKSKLVALPYRWIGVRPPLSLIEAMALGKCVITSSMDGNEEIIRNEYNGLILNFNNLNEVVSKISFLISNDYQRQNFGIQAKKTIKEMYSLKEYEKILDCYNIM
ncbi:MAG: glycosyltransferase family 4 protein [Candidatus Omnitrophica bacterium]|nr:glycosyltransferase family 4 protein [Candidatus Omnitrophota bacterium]